MSEQDLNQPKSEGGSFLSVQAVSALHLCSLSVKFAQHSGVAGKKLNVGMVTSKLDGSVRGRNTNTLLSVSCSLDV